MDKELFYVVLNAPDALPPREQTPPTPGTHWIAGWVDPIASLDNMKKRKFFTLLGLELQSLGGPARIQSLYRLGGSHMLTKF
jgi:hypothetical protein